MYQKKMSDKIRKSNLLNNRIFFAVLLAIISLYPLRWARTGIDLWDIGYSCGNYVNFNLHSISRPWFFSTYLSLLTGHLLSLLPYGNTLTGLKVWCGFVVSLTIALSGIFCFKRLKCPPFAVLAGEAWAVSICYVPGVILYNHLTYLFLILAIILLYVGLTDDRDLCLAGAGIALALNVFVRISNLPQVLLILSVFYYLFLTKSSASRYVRKILACVAGYLVTLLLVFMFIGSQYGLAEYVTGIRDMLDISKEAGDYSAGSMVKELLLAYIHGAGRLVYIGAFALAGCLVCYMIFKLRNGGKEGAGRKKTVYITAIVISAVLIAFLLFRRIMIFDFYHYATVYYTAAMYLVLMILICLLNMMDRTAPVNDRLILSLIFLQVLVMSIGSGTGIAPVMNSAFLIGPLLCLYLHRYFDRFYETKGDCGKLVSLVAIIALTAFFIQSLAFGSLYEFEEGGNGAGGKYTITGNRVLGKTKTTEEKAGLIQGLSDHVKKNGSSGKDVLIYGYAPALAFYLDLKPVITTWPDLDSYGVTLMERDISDLKKMIASGDHDLPLIIIDEKGAAEQREHNLAKWEIISGFIDEYGYTADYDNGRFTVFTCK